MSQLAPVVFVDEEKCVNCHACITACPVKFCIDGSGDSVKINHELCIGCGNCIDACTHDARSIIDDYDAFIAALEAGEPIVAVVAPAVAAHFPGEYLKLNGYLASKGVQAFFDVSFGAELTVKSYLEHIKINKPDMVIAQPCPAIVTYLEIYQPALLPHLAPADSPMLHAAKMIKEYFPEYKNHGIAVISPCIAKRREFDEVQIGKFNVTLKAIIEHMEESGVSVSGFPEVDFANPLPERAVLFSTPGGLKETVIREHPEYIEGIRKIEGPEIVYDYLEKLPEMVSRQLNPLLVDCLNCDLGCNGGPGTTNRDKSPDEVEHYVRMRRDEMQKRYRHGSIGKPNYKRKVNQALKDYWNPRLYSRTYVDRSLNNNVIRPADKKIESIYRSMHKYTDEDIYNCSACGYGSCEDMAIAIHNGLNKAENCHYYKHATIEREHAAFSDISDDLHAQILSAKDLITKIDGSIVSLAQKGHDQQASLEESSASIQEMIASISSAADITNERKESMSQLISSASNGQIDLGETIERVESITGSVKGIGKMIEVIDDVASHTNLLAINAAIEAAHAGDTGRGFSVVADEIRKLAEQTATNASTISGSLSEMIRDMGDVSERSKKTGDAVGKIIDDVRNMAESLSVLTNSMTELSVGTNQITGALSQLNSISTDLQQSYNEIGESIRSMSAVMQAMSDVSDRNIETLSTVDEVE